MQALSPIDIAKVIREINLFDVAAKLPGQLWQAPLMSFDDLNNYALNIPASTAEMLIKRGDYPPLFVIGRRRYARTADVLAWIDQNAEAHAYVPRVNNRATN